jgi:spermidine synthase
VDAYRGGEDETPYLIIPIRSDKLSLKVAVREHVHHSKTDYQTIDIYDTHVFGKMLLLDGHVQLTEFDEYAYHEALVHIPMLSLESPKRALVVGGGDGGVLRELCKHSSLQTIDLVEIDQGVIDACWDHLPQLNGGALNDPRVNVFVQDAFPFLRDVTEPYDLIVMDSTDVYEEEDGGLSEQLFTRDFYVDCKNALTPNGLLVTQADNLVFCPYSMKGILAMFSSVFDRIGCYQAAVPSFGGFSGYAWASQTGAVDSMKVLMRLEDLPLRYLNRQTVSWAFAGHSFE